MIWILLIGVPMLIGLWAQSKVSGAFNRWKQVRAASNLTGAEAAQRILAAANIHDVEIVPIRDALGDHYDPAKKRLCLSPDIYGTPSVAALGIAAHECGHAIQHANSYAPLKWRMLAVPATQFASQMLPIIFIAGLFFHAFHLIFIAIACFFVLVVFNLITLPVEFDASRRAKIILQNMGMVKQGEEASGVNDVLDAAALTYVAAFVAALGQLLFFILQATRSR
ncbi:MAG: zinc metallopeptidase [Verrucomicrobiaceae bacterium]|nr:MAG: zinc metallopeptidase [Verrucomicrobiaceae bacterium]